MADLQRLNELRDHGKMQWSEGDRGWAAQPRDVVTALAHEGFEEYKHEITYSRRDRPPRGGVWQGLNCQTGAVASAIWVQRSADAARSSSSTSTASRSTEARGNAMDDFWGDIEREVMKSLEGRGATPVIEVARRLAISEEAAASLLSQLAREGKVRICAVESAAPRGQAA